MSGSGEKQREPIQPEFNPAIMIDLQGAKITSDTGFLLLGLKGAGGTGDWHLFNLYDDPAEIKDLSEKHPEKRKGMLKLWDEYVKTNDVIQDDAGPFVK
jgi:hypothetical protein